MSNPNDGNLFLPLDVNFWDDPDILEVGERAAVLLQQIWLLSKRTMSDGVVSDLQVRKFGLPGTPARLKALEKRELIVRQEEGWVSPSYLKRNRSAAEIRETQRLEREGAALGNHRKWHGSKTNPRCDYCTGRLVDPNPPPDKDPTRVPDRGGESTETSTETEPKSRTTTRTRTGNSSEPAAREKDPIFDALCESCGINAKELTEAARGPLNKACKDLKDVGATPDEIHRRANAYKTTFAGMNLTPNALSRHWAVLSGVPIPVPEKQSGARIPAPRQTCGECDAGRVWDDGTNTTSPCPNGCLTAVSA